jgi:hypothetical protein
MEHNPLRSRGDAVMAFIERRESRQYGVIVVSHLGSKCLSASSYKQ